MADTTVQVNNAQNRPNWELVLYRLDETKGTLSDINAKLDAIADIYVPRREIEDRFKQVEDRFNGYQWWVRSAAILGLTSALTIVSEIVIRLLSH